MNQISAVEGAAVGSAMRVADLAGASKGVAGIGEGAFAGGVLGRADRLAVPQSFGSILRGLLGTLEIPGMPLTAGAAPSKSAMHPPGVASGVSPLQPAELLGLQMRVHDAALRMDLVSKIAESGLGVIRRFQNQ